MVNRFLRHGRRRWYRLRERLPLGFTGADRPPGLALISLLGIVCGLLSGAVIVGLHASFTALQRAIFGSLQASGFLALAPWARVALPIGGALILGLLYQCISKSWREGGIVHVIERSVYYQGILPVANAAVTFVGAVIAIACGQSVGREGVSAHLGATAGSVLGRRVGVPNNSVRTLVGCGVAAGIAASFHSPLSGVIFAMEVVMMEYTIVGFAPIILSAVSATLLIRLIPGGHPQVTVTAAELGSLFELPYLLLCGAVLGTVAALFTRLTAALATPLRRLPVWPRMTVAGAITAAFALPFPQIMGVGFHVLNSALAAQYGLLLALGIATAKIAATSAAMATSIPGGLIVPTLLIGATAGEALGVAGGFFNPEHASSPGFYALLGMGAMLGAVVQAPLTAMVLILELSETTDIIFPAMLTVITAMLVAREAFDVRPEFIQLLRQRGMDYRNDPVAQFLRRSSVIAAMERRFATLGTDPEFQTVQSLLERQPQWFLVRRGEERLTLLRAADVARFVNKLRDDDVSSPERVDISEIPGERLQAASIHLRATLQEAYDRLDATGAEALYVVRRSRRGRMVTCGVLTRQAIDNTYLP